MAKKTDEISSTEHLLAMIRSKGKPVDPSPAAHIPAATLKPKKKRQFPQLLALKKNYSVGIDIGHSALRMVKVRHYSTKKQEVADIANLALEPGLAIGSPRFNAFFKSSLKQFCGPSKTTRIWGVTSSAQVELRYIRIPKVPKKQIANAVFWTYKKEVPFNEAEMIFDFQVLGEVNEDGTPKTEVMVYTAPKGDLDRIKRLFSKSGYSPEGITIVPFATQNLFRNNWLDSQTTNVCSLYIGQDWSRIDIFGNNNLVLSRGVKTGINSFIEAIREELEDEYASPSSELDTATGGEPPGSSPFATIDDESNLEAGAEPFPAPESPHADLARRMFFSLSEHHYEDGEQAPLPFTAEEIFEMCMPALERLIRQVERALGYYAANFEGQTVTRLYLSGGICSHKSIIAHIFEQLAITGSIIDPFESSPHVAPGLELPETVAERSSLVPAMGLALSNNTLTPNFICTYRDKAQIDRLKRVNQSLLLGFIVAMLIGFGVYAWIGYQAGQKQQRIAALQKEISQFTPRVDKNMIIKLAAQIRQRNRMVKQQSRKFLSLGILSEVARLTPRNVRLVSFSADMGEADPPPDSEDNWTVDLSGIVIGPESSHQSGLAAFLVNLKNSPLFNNLEVAEEKRQYYLRKPVLQFEIEMEIPAASDADA